MRSPAAPRLTPRKSSTGVRLASVLLVLAALAGALFLAREERGTDERPRAPSGGGTAAEVPELATALGASAGRTPARALARSGVVRGTLRDETGAPLPDASARLRLTSDRGGWRAGSARPDGSFEFRGLSLGHWSLECVGEDVRCDDAEVVLSAEAALVELDLVAERGRWLPLDVHVAAQEDEDTPFPPCYRLRPVVVDPWSVFGVGSDPRDAHAPRSDVRELGPETRVFVPRSRGVEVELWFGEHLLARRGVGPGDERCAFVVAAGDALRVTGRLTLRLVDETGAPLADASARGWIDRAVPCELRVSADGAVAWASPPGEVTLFLGGPERENRVVRARVPSGGAVALGDIVLARAHLASGRVLDREGRPCSVPLRCERAETGGTWTECAFQHGPFSSTGGHFVLDHLGPGRHRVTALVPGSPATEFECGGGAPLYLAVLAGPP